MGSVVAVEQGQYWLTEENWDETAQFESISGYGNGLLAFHGHTLVVSTGTYWAPLELTVEISDDEPALRLEEWDEVVEVSNITTTGSVAVKELFGDVRHDLPMLGVAPNTWYRARVHARGRDEADLKERYYEEIVEPVEKHLVQLWPAPRAEEIRHKLTDQYGEVMRAQEAESFGKQRPPDPS